MDQLKRINPRDNVLVVCKRLNEGDMLEIGGQQIVVSHALGLGHKVAAVALKAGDPVVKFGLPIGVATTAIAAGEHIHLHNMKSNFISTYTLDHEFIKNH